MDYKVRFIKKSDLDKVYEIEQECFINPWKRSDLEYELEGNPVNKFLVVEKDGEIIGFIDFMITFNSATISQIAITKKYRRQGIASLLIREMEMCFPKEGEDIVENVTLEVRASNVPAIKLYEKDGYEVVVKKPHYYPDGEDAIYMVKRLMLCR